MMKSKRDLIENGFFDKFHRDGVKVPAARHDPGAKFRRTSEEDRRRLQAAEEKRARKAAKKARA